MSSVSTATGEPGERLLPHIVDHVAATDPDRILYSFTKTKDPSDGFIDVTARVLARAVDRCSWYLEEQLGRGKGFPTLAYLGPQDLIYGILMVACIKTGHKVLFSSLRNTLEAHISLMEATNCHTFLLPPNYTLPVAKQILEAREMRVIEIAHLSQWIDEEGPHTSYPYSKTWPEARLDPIMVLHTSGSTGLPKPIPQTQASYSCVDAFTTLPSLGLKPVHPVIWAGSRVYVSLPLFHCAGMTAAFIAPIYLSYTAVIGPFPSSAKTANSMHLHGNVRFSMLAPAILVDIAKVPEYLDNLSKVDNVVYGSGPCPQAVGDLISTKTHLSNVIGTTECIMLPIPNNAPEDWAYLEFSAATGAEYRPISEGLFEQVIVRNPQYLKYQGIFGNFPQLNEWPMKDIYSKHPTKEGLWLYRGRLDDIVVLSNGEKINPITMEGTVTAHPLITGVLVTGLARTQPSLLVETIDSPTTDAETAALIGSIWPCVQEANKAAPGHGKIHRDKILFTSAEKPMLRAGKGSIQRQLTLSMYEAELDALYKKSEEKGGDEINAKPLTNGVAKHDISLESLRNIVAESTDIAVQEISSEADLFEYGLDSLQIRLLVQEINKVLAANGSEASFDAQTIYANPTIGGLYDTMSVSVAGNASIEDRVEINLKKTQQLYETQSAHLPVSERQALAPSSDNRVVLVTGTTGSLGSYILDSLSRDSKVSRIYCLNRGQDSRARQEKSQATRELAPLSQKVECLEATLSEPYFGLTRQEYRKLLSQVTDIVHNAWQVDFNLSVNSFASHVDAVGRIIEFSTQSAYGAKVLFVSSVAAVGGLTGDVPEVVFDDWQTPLPSGYGQSKFVAERILHLAARECKVPVIICRLGQVAGPVRSAAGVWPKQEWLPTLIRSSQYLGVLPNSLGRSSIVDWIPVDVLGDTIGEQLFKPVDPKSSSAVVYNTANPRHANWADLVPTVASHILTREGKKVEIVSLQTWLDALLASEHSTEDVTENPAIKLLEFMKGLASSREATMLTTKNASVASPTLAGLEPVQGAWMLNWLQQWEF